MIVNPIELICCELLYMIVCDNCVYSRRDVCVDCVYSRRECMMHNLVEIQIRFWRPNDAQMYDCAE